MEMKRVLKLIIVLAVLLFPGIIGLAEQGTNTEPTAAPEPTIQPTEVPAPQVRFSRDFSTRYAEYGDQVTLSYTVRNEGVLPIEQVVISDSLVGEVGVVERLESGEKKTISARVRITESCTSTPRISYECAGQGYSEERGAERIHLAQVRLKVELSADKTNVAPGEMVTLRLNVVNEGNVNLYGLRASEPVLGDTGSVVSVLPPGDECVLTRTVQMKSTNTFQFSLAGSSDTGGAISVQSNEMSILVTPVAAEILLSLRAEADRTELSGPGEVSFSLYVSNDCSLELRNVTLSEESLGEIRNLVFVPPGEMPVITDVRQIDQSGTYRFQAQVIDSVGDRLTVYSDPIEIIVTEAALPPEPSAEAAETVLPQESGIPVLDGMPYRMEEEPATFEKLMAGSALVLLAMLAIWYLAVKISESLERIRRARRKRRKKNKRAKGKK